MIRVEITVNKWFGVFQMWCWNCSNTFTLAFWRRGGSTLQFCCTPEYVHGRMESDPGKKLFHTKKSFRTQINYISHKKGKFPKTWENLSKVKSFRQPYIHPRVLI